MFTLRCTRKLLRRLGATPSSEAIAPSSVLGCMNDAVVQLQAYPRRRRGELPALVDLELHLAENIYSLTEYRTPWMRALELFGVQGTVRVGRVPQGCLH
jgi:hypothetical protein